MDASVFGSTVADQSAYVSQSALYATAGGPVGEEGEARAAAPGLQTSRSFFIIDKSRMVGERDTVEEAKVVYLPENEFMKELYNSRCSCLVGVADVYRNMTGEFPQCLSMSGCCYACQLLEPNFFMFLLGRPLEPPERVMATLQHISDIFHFYYHSPQAVMTKSRDDWTMFTLNMTFIFSKIREYVFRDPHSISFMFPTLSYNQSGNKQKRSRLFLQASHILRSCQQQESIVGGCIMYNTEIVCNQLPPRLMEKLQVIGGNGIELNTKSILAENVAPETVWVLEVYLTPEEVEDMADSQRDLPQHRRAYREMTPNPSLIDSAVTFCSRFQSTAGHTPSSSSSRSGRRAPRTTSGWRSRSRAPEPNPGIDDDDYYNVSMAFHSLTSQKSTESVGHHSGKSDGGPQAVFSAHTTTVTVLPLLTQAPTGSPQVSRSRTRGGGAGREGVGSGRGRAGPHTVAVDRRMPRLHGNSGRRDFTNRPYQNPNYFPVNANLPPTPSKPQETNTNPPPLPPPRDGTQETDSQETKSNPQAPTPPIPASLSIPIPATQSGNSGGGGSSSLDDERFTTPSPNFSMIPSALEKIPSALEKPAPPVGAALGVAAQTVDAGATVVNGSNYFETADEPPNPPPVREEQKELETGKGVWSIYNTLTPSLPIPQTHKQRQQQRQKLEESEDDFVDSSVLDQLLSDTRLANQHGTGNGHTENSVEGRGTNDRDSPPELPPRNYEIEVDPPPPLPPRGPSTTTATLVASEKLISDSGEFTVIDLSAHQTTPPPPAHRREGGVEISRAESTPPPSPPPRTLSLPPEETLPREHPGVPQEAITDTPKEKEISDTQKEEEEVLGNLEETEELMEGCEEIHTAAAAAVVEGDRDVGDDQPDRSGSSSPDRQHRGLTQSVDLGSGEDGNGEEGEEGRCDPETVWESVRVIEGRGWLGETENEPKNEQEGEKEENDVPNEEEEEEGGDKEGSGRSSSVDPLKYGETPLSGSLGEDGAVEESSSVTSTAEVLTSDEEEDGSDDEGVVSVNSASLRYYRRPQSTSTPHDRGTRAAGGREEERPSALESLSIQNLSLQSQATPTGGGATPSLSFNQLNTPEMTLQLSMAERLRGTADSGQSGVGGAGEGVWSQAAMVASDIARIHQTLGRQLQPPAAKPAPPLETWCIYVQRQFNTIIVLGAKAGLQDNHSLLTQLWKSLLPQLFALDQGLEGLEVLRSGGKPYNLTVYNNIDKHCAVENRKALYKFRHAIRYTHVEYEKDPDLCQVTLLNSPKMVSQRVMGREVYYHHPKSLATDVFTTTAMLTKTARQVRQNLISGQTPAHFL